MDLDKELSPRQIGMGRIYCAILGLIIGSTMLILIIYAIAGVFSSCHEGDKEIKPTGNQKVSLNHTNKNINMNTVTVGSSFKGPEQSGSQWGNSDHRSFNDVRDGLQNMHYYCQEYLDRTEIANLLTLILSISFGLIFFLEFFVSLVMTLIHLQNVRRVKRNEKKALKKEFLEAKQELDAIRNAKNQQNQPREQEGREVEGPNERILNQRRVDHLNLCLPF